MAFTTLAAAAGSAAADTITTDYLSSTGLTGYVVRPEIAGSVNVHIGRQTHLVTGHTGLNHQVAPIQQWFCIEVTDWLEDPNTFTVASVESAPIPGDDLGGNGMGSEKADTLRRLWRAASDWADVPGNANFLEGIDQAARNTAAMFQVLVWEIVHEDNFDPSTAITQADLTTANGGEFYVASGPAQSQIVTQMSNANSFLRQMILAIQDLNGDFESRLVAFTDIESQDLLGMIAIPLPSPTMAAGLGLIGLVSIRRRRSV